MRRLARSRACILCGDGVKHAMTLAITLGGGGSKGDFEIGALHYLYEQGRRPDILATTSVGSVNGLKLAEGEGAPDQGLAGLTAIWLGLRTPADFAEEAEWLLQAEPSIRFVRQYLLDVFLANAGPVEDDLALNDSLRELRQLELLASQQRLQGLGVGEQTDGLQALLGLHVAAGLLLPTR